MIKQCIACGDILEEGDEMYDVKEIDSDLYSEGKLCPSCYHEMMGHECCEGCNEWFDELSHNNLCENCLSEINK